MSADGDIVREALTYRPLEGQQMHEKALAALARLEAAEAERDEARHGRELARLDTENERRLLRAAEADRDRLHELLQEVEHPFDASEFKALLADRDKWKKLYRDAVQNWPTDTKVVELMEDLSAAEADRDRLAAALEGVAWICSNDRDIDRIAALVRDVLAAVAGDVREE